MSSTQANSQSPNGAGESANEWQPARLRDCHPRVEVPGVPAYLDEETIKKAFGRLVHIRICDELESAWAKKIYEPEGCNAERFYFVHPNDSLDGLGGIVCEHEVLTD